jgi:hypothetical protein
VRSGTVRGLATLAAGPPLGRSLTALTDATRVPADLARALAAAADEVATGAVAGEGETLRRAVALLGAERGQPGGRELPVRATLQAIASHPATDAPLARAAAATADAIAAQPLAALTPATPAADPGATGAYLQVPLPGGATAELRVGPDGDDGEGRGGAPRPRRIAFLLHLSALGTVAIDALAGPDGVDASVRATGDAARAFLAARAPELVRSLAEAGVPASVGVRAIEGAPPARLAAPPPSGGLDLSV